MGIDKVIDLHMHTNYSDGTDTVTEILKKAGGLVFVPHVYIYGDNSKRVFENIINYKIDGFECYYSRFIPEQTNFLLDFCKKNGLYISGGSDYHGNTKPDIDIGTGVNMNLNIKEEVIKPWV